MVAAVLFFVSPQGMFGEGKHLAGRFRIKKTLSISLTGGSGLLDRKKLNKSNKGQNKGERSEFSEPKRQRYTVVVGLVARRYCW